MSLGEREGAPADGAGVGVAGKIECVGTAAVAGRGVAAGGGGNPTSPAGAVPTGKSAAGGVHGATTATPGDTTAPGVDAAVSSWSGSTSASTAAAAVGVMAGARTGVAATGTGVDGRDTPERGDGAGTRPPEPTNTHASARQTKNDTRKSTVLTGTRFKPTGSRGIGSFGSITPTRQYQLIAQTLATQRKMAAACASARCGHRKDSSGGCRVIRCRTQTRQREEARL
jgi:hypothetical protein